MYLANHPFLKNIYFIIFIIGGGEEYVHRSAGAHEVRNFGSPGTGTKRWYIFINTLNFLNLKICKIFPLSTNTTDMRKMILSENIMGFQMKRFASTQRFNKRFI